MPVLFRRVEFARPADHHQHRAGGAQRHEVEPAPVERHGHQPRVEQREIAEESAGIVDARGQQHGREKTAQQAEDRHHLRLESHGEDKRRGRDQRHQQEQRRHVQEVVEIPGRT
ncbi:MAG: hypothetical protein WDM96_10230 [Lacunisphaera sp.]